jgi:hypothetical protein
MLVNQNPNNPLQRLQQAYQAMSNPAAFVRNAFPDIPAQIQNDPNQILQYIQQTRNISPAQIKQLVSQYPYGR